MKGKFRPINPKKYKGNVLEIFYRSSYEFKFMTYLDSAENVTKWSSEQTIIPYLCPVHRYRRRYFPDFWVQYKDGTEEIIEIKPYHETIPPVRGKKKEKTFLKEVIKYSINTAKWKAAEDFCQRNRYKWSILTEKDLGIK